MLVANDIEDLARRLRNRVKSKGQRQPLPEAQDGNIREAYSVQAAYQQLLASEGLGPIVGHKIALTSDAMQRMVGVSHPLAGALFDAYVETGPASVKLSDFCRVGVEFELAVRLKRDLGPATHEHGHGHGHGHGRAYDGPSVADAVGAVAPAYELVEDGNADYDNIDAYGLIAENCWNAGVVLGTFSEAFTYADLASRKTSLRINGELKDEALAGDVMGHPFEVVAWVANHLIESGSRLEAGMIIMTGSSITTRFPQQGDVLQFSVAGFDSIDLEVMA